MAVDSKYSKEVRSKDSRAATYAAIAHALTSPRQPSVTVRSSGFSNPQAITIVDKVILAHPIAESDERLDSPLYQARVFPLDHVSHDGGIMLTQRRGHIQTLDIITQENKVWEPTGLYIIIKDDGRVLDLRHIPADIREKYIDPVAPQHDLSDIVNGMFSIALNIGNDPLLTGRQPLQNSTANTTGRQIPTWLGYVLK